MKNLLRLGISLAFLLGLMSLPLVLAHGQAKAVQPPTPKLMIFVDTAGVSRAGDDVYVTWVFAKAGPNTPPSSGILVAFDCGRHMVRRLAHVVYHLTPDSTAVTGNVAPDDGPWVTVSIPKLFDMVCEIGRALPKDDPPPPPTDPRWRST
jgi:hypothetical protein